MTTATEANTQKVEEKAVVAMGSRIISSSKRKKRTKCRKQRRIRYLERKAKRALKYRARKSQKEKKQQKLALLSIPEHRHYFEELEAPQNFSVINNTEEVLGYFRNVGRHLSRRTQIRFNLEKIKQLTPDAIALLIARVKDENFTHRLTVEGNKPLDKELARLFDESGFLNHVRSSYKPPDNENSLLIHQITHKKVFPDVAKKVSELAVKHTFKDEKKFQPIFKIMIEAMANTDNHASLKKEGVYDWWLFTYCNPTNHSTAFTFLDLGIGIFNSNPVNEYKTGLLNTIENLTNIDLTARDNVELVPKLFSGDIYTSRTRNKKRGQGLPSIKELSENEHIKNFTIITNNIKIKLPSMDSEVLANKFNGTMLYWELHP